MSGHDDGRPLGGPFQEVHETPHERRVEMCVWLVEPDRRRPVRSQRRCKQRQEGNHAVRQLRREDGTEALIVQPQGDPSPCRIEGEVDPGDRGELATKRPHEFVPFCLMVRLEIVQGVRQIESSRIQSGCRRSDRRVAGTTHGGLPWATSPLRQDGEARIHDGTGEVMSERTQERVELGMPQRHEGQVLHADLRLVLLAGSHVLDDRIRTLPCGQLAPWNRVEATAFLDPLGDHAGVPQGTMEPELVVEHLPRQPSGRTLPHRQGCLDLDGPVEPRRPHESNTSAIADHGSLQALRRRSREEVDHLQDRALP
jgi:hypothetical protein